MVPGPIDQVSLRYQFMFVIAATHGCTCCISRIRLSFRAHHLKSDSSYVCLLQGLGRHIGDLPAILLVAIMDNLDSETLLQAAPVCKLWACVYKSALHQLDISYTTTTIARAWGAAGWLQKNGKCLQGLRYASQCSPFGTERTIISAVPKLTQLRALELDDVNLHLQTPGLAAFQSLTSLSLPRCHLADADLAALRPLSALCKLNLSGNDGIDAASEAFASFSRALAQLTTLDLSACFSFV